ncbi:hypothetical protein GCM10009841_13940 [Microlunatus panaciterrae]|uniref:Ribonuclease E n=1 Tax=Microlunatus panaciterrae TaxID=400768 RepID=A0ABS2RPT6_9ACTN|nr:ribonuclease E [Microlunatus panaciterrae]
MLENEPDTSQNTAATTAAPSEPAPPRRRRAASRPAGPPASAPEAPPIQVSAPVSPTQETVAAPVAEPQPTVAAPAAEGDGQATAPAKKAPAKRTAKRATAKKAASPNEAPAATSPNEAPAAAGEAAAVEPTARTPRKRTAKKAAPAQPEPKTGQAAEAPIAEPTSPAAPFSGSPHDDQTQQAPAEAVAEKKPARRRTRRPVSDPFAVPDFAVSRPQPESQAAPTTEVPTPEAELVEDEEAAALLAAEQATAEESAAEPEPTDQPGADQEAGEQESAEQDSEDTDDESGDGQPRRRRRRRGGRRRRRGGSDDTAESDEEDTDSSDEAEKDQNEPGQSADDAAQETSHDDGDEGESEGQRRRRRRRRRRGEDAGAAPDDPSEVVVRVREPRSRKQAQQQVTGIEGSTRMEAKRQRRRDGREAGRRRAPILSEAEFLARRESVDRKMIIRQREDLSQIAVLEDGILVEHYVDRDSAASLIGNVYLGRVQNVLPSMEAAFIDIGRGRNAVLYAGEVDWESFGAEGQNRKVEKALKSGQTVLVQVSKDPVGAKGARLTNHVSIPGRYIVYAPGGHLSGISRKLPDTERKRLKDILADLVGDQASVIVRTAAEGASEEELVRDVNRLKAQWEDIERKVKAGSAPQLLYGEPDLTVRIVRDLFTEDFNELIIQGNGSVSDAYDSVEAYVSHVAPHLKDRLTRWDADSDGDLFAAHRLDEQIAKGLERKVFLPSGGSLIIDRTEAMTVIDVNTGKFTGAGGNLEATVTSNNLEAAEEIVNQLRLRDIGGIIVIDFIDMVLPANRELLLRRLVECLGRDRTRHQVAEVTSLGLVQMTRKKIGTGLLEAFSAECEHCQGRGVQLHDVPVESQKQADGGTRDAGNRNRRNQPGRQGSGNQGPRPGNQSGKQQPAGDREKAGEKDKAAEKENSGDGSRDGAAAVDASTQPGTDQEHREGSHQDGANREERSGRSRRRRGRGGEAAGDDAAGQETPAVDTPAADHQSGNGQESSHPVPEPQPHGDGEHPAGDRDRSPAAEQPQQPAMVEAQPAPDPVTTTG